MANYCIISDSESSLKALQQPFTTNAQIFEIQNQILKNNSKVSLFWTKAHVGTKQNEEADKLAKLATAYKMKINYLPIPKSVFKSKLNSHLNQFWVIEWNTTIKAIETKNYIQDLQKFPSILTKSITCFITGHGPFPTYLYRFNLKDDDLCQCGDVGSPQHYLFNCPYTENLHYPQTRYLKYLLVEKIPGCKKQINNLDQIYDTCLQLTRF